MASGSCKTKDVQCIRGIISLWDLTGNQPIRHPTKASGSLAFAFSPNGKLLALPNDDHSIILWDIVNHQIRGRPLSGLTDSVKSIAFNQDGRTIAAAGDSIIFWDVESSEIIRQPIKGNVLDDIYNIAFSPDGKILALGGLDTIILWNIDTGKSIGQPIKGTENYQMTFAFSPNSKTLVIGSLGSKDITFRQIATGSLQGPPLVEPGGFVSGLAFSPDGKTLISAGKSINFWNMHTGQPDGQSLTGHGDGIGSLDLSPDGKTLASGSCGESGFGICLQGEIILWDVDSRKQVGNPIIVNGTSVDKVVFSPDGSSLALATISGGISLFDMDPKAWATSNCQRAGRNFTHDEWARYFPNEDYPTQQDEATCPQWPLDTEVTSTPTP